MNFIEGRIRLDEKKLGMLARLLAELNQAARRTFARSIAQKIPPNSIDESWADVAGCFTTRDGDDQRLTNPQHHEVVRHARNLRITSNARARWLSEHYAKLASASTKKIARIKSDIERLSKDLGPLRQAKLKAKNAKLLETKKFGLRSTMQRKDRLLEISKRQTALAHSGLASQAFCGSKLAKQRQQLDTAHSPFRSESHWKKTWNEARNHSWLFEGAKHAASANNNVKMNIDEGLIRVRLTERQSLERMDVVAKELNVPLAELSKNGTQWGKQRMDCRYLSLELNLTRQSAKLDEFIQALTPSADPKYKKISPPCAAPISWELRIEGDISNPSKCKAYARATWQTPSCPTTTSPANGCLGLDINSWGLSIAYCDSEGNKPAKGGSFLYTRPIDWFGSSKQSLHQIRLAAKEIVDGASQLGVPLALELLDFDELKLHLRYDPSPARRRQLSGFAYKKLQDAIMARGKKKGVEIRWVESAWTTLVGWAKYGSRLGLNPDQAAAFCIARKGTLSKPEQGHMKVGRRKNEVVPLHAKKERLEGLGCSSGLASYAPTLSLKTSTIIQLDQQGQPALTRIPPGRGQITPARKDFAERRLALALGQDRRYWPQRLKSSASKARISKGQIISRALMAGKAPKDRDSRLPAQTPSGGESLDSEN